MPDLVLGVLFPTSGTLGDIGAQCAEAVRYAVREHTPPGWKIQLVEGDPATPERAASEAERLVREGAGIVVGTLLSHLCLPASQVVDRAGGMYWEAIASADEVTARGLAQLFRLDGSAARYGAAAVDLVVDVLAPAWGIPLAQLRAGTIAEGSAFPLSFAAACRRAASARGLPVVADVVCDPVGADAGLRVEKLRAARVDVLLSAGFSRSVAALWRALRERPLGVRGIVGISGWAFPRAADLGPTPFDRVFVIAAPYLYSADRSGLSPASRALLERWWAGALVPASQELAVDRDLVYAAMHVLLTHVLPMSGSGATADLAIAARGLDLPMGASPIGYGVRFDATGDNERSYAIAMQWQGGRRVTIEPSHLANATLDVRAPTA